MYYLHSFNKGEKSSEEGEKQKQNNLFLSVSKCTDSSIRLVEIMPKLPCLCFHVFVFRPKLVTNRFIIIIIKRLKKK